MADKKISALPAATTPLAGTEVLPIVQGGTTDQVSVANLTAGRAVTMSALGVSVAAPATGVSVAGTTAFTWVAGGTSSALVTIGTQGTAGSSLFVNTPSLNSSFASGLAIDGTYPGGTGISVINVKAVGVQSGGGYGSDLAFHTASGVTLTEQMRISSAGNITASTGNVVIGTAGKGITLPGNITWTSGANSPEGVVTAPVGSLFSRTNGGAATSLYVKESGTGNTGWVAK